jgi:hypothetical protein
VPLRPCHQRVRHAGYVKMLVPSHLPKIYVFWDLTPFQLVNARNTDNKCRPVTSLFNIRTSNLAACTNKRSNVRVTLRRVRESLLPWKSNKYYLLICVFMRACGYAGSMASVCNVHAPYSEVICGPSVSTKFFDIIS